jgi:hypothetical protein
MKKGEGGVKRKRDQTQYNRKKIKKNLLLVNREMRMPSTDFVHECDMHQQVLFSASERTNSVASVREQTTPTEQPPLVGEVSANVWG